MTNCPVRPLFPCPPSLLCPHTCIHLFVFSICAWQSILVDLRLHSSHSRSHQSARASSSHRSRAPPSALPVPFLLFVPCTPVAWKGVFAASAHAPCYAHPICSDAHLSIHIMMTRPSRLISLCGWLPLFFCSQLCILCFFFWAIVVGSLLVLMLALDARPSAHYHPSPWPICIRCMRNSI